MAGWVAGAVVGSSVLGALASGSAADQQAQAAADAQAQQLAMFNVQNKQLAPSRAAGYNALNQIGKLSSGQSQTYDANGDPILGADGNPVMQTGTGYFTHQFDNTDLNSNLAPNYAFQLGQGTGANLAQSNATGGLVGGNAMKGLQDYTQNYAGNAYQNAFTNYNTQRTGIYNTLAGIAGLGQNAQNTGTALAQNVSANNANLGIGAATASAGGTMGIANSLGGGLNTLGGIGYQNYLGNQNNITGGGNASPGIKLV